MGAAAAFGPLRFARPAASRAVFAAVLALLATALAGGCATPSGEASDRRILSSAGPLPVRCEFETRGGGQLLFVAGSAWSGEEGVLLLVDVLIDGSIVGQGRVFSNGPATHRGLVFPHLPLTLTKGRHSLELRRGSGDTTSDAQDFYEVTLTER